MICSCHFLRCFVLVYALLLCTWSVARAGDSGQYVVYNAKLKHPENGYPKAIAHGVWKGISAKELSASFYLPDTQKLYFFQKNKVLRYSRNSSSIDKSYPRALNVEFATSKNQRVDAALYEYKSRRLFLFFGKSYCEFNYKPSDKKFNFIKCQDIQVGFKGIRGPIQAATSYPDGKAYLFQGTQYYRYDLHKKRLDKKFPRPIDEFSWSGVWPSGVNAALYMPHELAEGANYFFKNRGLTKARLWQKNVIFITLDGLRYEEFFNGTDPILHNGKHQKLFKIFWEKYAQEGVIYGDPRLNAVMKINNATGVSHPAYVNLFSGYYETYCQKNSFGDECPRFNRTTTFIERLVNELGVPREKVATFSSWKRVEDAIEKNKGTTIFNGGKDIFVDPYYPLAHDKINREQVAVCGISDDPDEVYNERPDIFTFRHSMTYLKNHKPKFLYIHLAETDALAHQDDYGGLIKEIAWCDGAIDEVIQTLNGMGDYGKNTVLIITTDHGRGRQQAWKEHGKHLSEKNWKNVQKVWAYIRDPQVPGQGPVKHQDYSHAYLRPTMEALMGLQPRLGAEFILKEGP